MFQGSIGIFQNGHRIVHLVRKPCVSAVRGEKDMPRTRSGNSAIPERRRVLNPLFRRETEQQDFIQSEIHQTQVIVIRRETDTVGVCMLLTPPVRSQFT